MTVHDRRRATFAGAYLLLGLVWAGLAIFAGHHWWHVLLAVAWLGLGAWHLRQALDPAAPPSKPLWSKDDGDYR